MDFRLTQTDDTSLDPTLLADFKASLADAKVTDREAWDRSSRLVGKTQAADSLARLTAAVQASTVPHAIKAALLAALSRGSNGQAQDIDSEALKRLTGLPATKALRALLVFFGVVVSPQPRAIGPAMQPETVEAFLRAHANPFDLLLEAEAPSLLDLGAGDLTFADEVVARYLPPLQSPGKPLTLHCVDRIHPDSRLAGPLQADPERLARLRAHPPDRLDFHYWGNQDLFDLRRLKKLRPRYTLATCNAPPTPTVALEPTRLSPSVIAAYLRQTKGDFRRVRVDGEDALEVLHQGRALLFPPWKFDIHGPLALLEVLAQRGSLVVLSAVDQEVFWELLAQLLEGERYRPKDLLFTAASLPQIFGEVHARLAALPIGGSLLLADVAPLRRTLPAVLPGHETRPYRFRSVAIRRGATFDGLPAGRTARLFGGMKEEQPPWMLTLVPEEVRQ